jgi:tol-pal system protein YbgF
MVLFFSGCAANKEMIQIREELQDVKQQLWEIQKANEQITSNIDELSKNMGEELSSDIDTFKKYHTNTQLHLDAIKTDIQILGEKINDTNFRLSSLADQIVTRQAYPETRPYYPSGESFSADSVRDPSDLQNEIIPEALFDDARQDYLNGNYDLALQGFNEYLERFPVSEFADDAQYWVAQSYYDQERYSLALQAYDKLIQQYAKSDKIQSAFLKKGLCHFELNQIAKGVVQLQRLLEKYPESDEARIAKEHLENMGLKGD